MKVMSVGLISLIIFNIVLAKNTSDSGSTKGCFSFLKKKIKTAHKTADEPVKVKGKGTHDPDLPNLQFIDEFDPMLMEIYKGNQTELDKSIISETNGAIVNKATEFLRSENESRRKGWYIRPYEEDYEDMIKDSFISLKNNYQYNQNNSNKRDDTPHSVYKGPGKQKFTEERQLSTINKKDSNDENEKDLLCTDPEETKQAEELINEALIHLVYHATSEDGYKVCINHPEIGLSYYKKEHQGNTNILKVKLNFTDINKYNEIINKLWEFDRFTYFYIWFYRRKIVREYNPNLVILQQRYRRGFVSRQKYFYALAKKVEISKDKTIFVMVSPNINDGYPSDIEFKNTIIESANLFKIDIDSDDDIKADEKKEKEKKKKEDEEEELKLIKTFVNIAGVIIEKKDECVDITYVESINGHSTL
ncbi:fam-a protein [Plasmodium vinckei lentum]|uniref:Fam-a protein n=1 Tax=Plasmodium vinckei lentum TaxID=138297 RepID=A0A6V7S131_PLAVN|nr:fam-a protein [Plasmodium vinckei lentum]